ncbi:hypothetical protein TNCV_4305511 [Trichonephila clavipes]|nr:hypothetical protein TNCV_4305511 [Trichonephila clavipes]
MLSIRWSTTAELSNHHSSCRAVSSSIRVAGGGKRDDTARPRASQRFSMGLRSVKQSDCYVPGTTLIVPLLIGRIEEHKHEVPGHTVHSFMCNLRRTVAADIALPMDAVPIDFTRVEVALIPLGYNGNISIFRGVVTLGLLPSDNCLCGLELFP